MTSVCMRGYKGYDIEIPMHSATHKSDVNLAQKIKNTCPMHHIKIECLIQVNTENGQLNISLQNNSIVFRSSMV